jgi:hypothetical protein
MAKSNPKWTGVQSHIERARKLAAKYDVDKVNPNDYLEPVKDDWSDLLNRIR